MRRAGTREARWPQGGPRTGSPVQNGLEPVGDKGRGPRGSREPPRPPPGGSSPVGAHQKHTCPPATMRACGRGSCPQTSAPSRRPHGRSEPCDTRRGSRPASSTAFSASGTDRPFRSGTSATRRRRPMPSPESPQPEPRSPRDRLPTTEGRDRGTTRHLTVDAHDEGSSTTTTSASGPGNTRHGSRLSKRTRNGPS